jgi:hypothetical protein
MKKEETDLTLNELRLSVMAANREVDKPATLQARCREIGTKLYKLHTAACNGYLDRKSEKAVCKLFADWLSQSCQLEAEARVKSLGIDRLKLLDKILPAVIAIEQYGRNDLTSPLFAEAAIRALDWLKATYPPPAAVKPFTLIADTGSTLNPLTRLSRRRQFDEKVRQMPSRS